MSDKKKSCFIISCFGLLLFFPALLLALIGIGSAGSEPLSSVENSYTQVAGDSKSKNKFLVVPIQGVILTNKDHQNPLDTLFGDQYTYGYTVKDSLVKASKDKSIKGVLLQISSPGGTITGAKAISDGVKYYKDITGNPVISHISEMGASGAYWSAVSSDYIMADSGSLTGSIGVILGPFKYYNTVLSESGFLGSVSTAEGIDTYYITAGENKDFGNPYKKMPQKVKDVLQEGINNEYARFVKYVSARRGISESTIKDRIGALVYEDTQARDLNLIDSVGSRDLAYAELAKRAGITNDDYQMVSEKSAKGFWASAFEYLAPAKIPAASAYNPLTGKPLFLYGDPADYFQPVYSR